jgi:FkbM family methyltransferase
VLPDDVVRDPARCVAALSAHGVTRLVLVPSLLRALLEAGVDLAPLRRLRFVSACGERIPGELCRLFHQRLPWARLINQYGASEMNDVLWFEATADSGDDGDVPIGRPLPNTEAYVLDARLEPLPDGVPGDLHIATPGLARGYLGRPDLTAERFVPHPFATRPGERLYVTGDRARRRADGVLQCLGRRDHQIKLRGVRVELFGVEAVLRQHPDVRQAVVLPREAQSGAAHLVAYVETTPERAPTVEGQPRHTLPNGLALAQLNRNETEFLYQELFEGLTYLKHGLTLRDGDVVFDVGANIGLFALFAHERARGVRVFAFEPNPSAWEALRRNTGLYGVDARLFRCGLAAAGGQARFTFYPRFTFMSGLYAEPEVEKQVVRSFIRKHGGRTSSVAGLAPGEDAPEAVLDELLDERFEAQTFDVELRTLSDVLRESGEEVIGLLKVNVEKAELDVLLGVRDEDWARVRQVVVQVHDHDGRLGTVTGLLRRHGFELTVVQDWAVESSQNVHYVYARRGPGADAPPAPVRRFAPPLEAAELRRFAAERLPEAQVPSAFVFVEALPLTPNGKVDRRALQALEARGSERAYVAPRTDDERALCALVAEVVHAQRVGLEDDFFQLGGHSLLATQVVARVRRDLGVELPVRALFETPTVAGLARRVAAERQAPEADADLLALVAGLSDDDVRRALDAAAREETQVITPGHGGLGAPVLDSPGSASCAPEPRRA